MSSPNRIHWSFWLVTVLLLIWNALGSVNFLVQLNPESIESYREVEQAIIAGRPLWATIGFALAVFGGTLGALLLLLRAPWSAYLFWLALAGAIIAVVHSLTVDATFGAGELVGIVAMPIAIAVFQVWFVRFSIRKGWIKSE